MNLYSKPTWRKKGSMVEEDSWFSKADAQYLSYKNLYWYFMNE